MSPRMNMRSQSTSAKCSNACANQFGTCPRRADAIDGPSAAPAAERYSQSLPAPDHCVRIAELKRPIAKFVEMTGAGEHSNGCWRRSYLGIEVEVNDTLEMAEQTEV